MAQPRDISLTVMLEWLANDDEVAVLRSDACYEVLVDRLKRVSKKPQLICHASRRAFLMKYIYNAFYMCYNLRDGRFGIGRVL